MESSNAMIRSRGLRVGSLFYLWFVIAFVLGTAVLLYPVRWLTSTLHARSAGQTVENVLVIALVVLYVVASVVIAFRVNRYVCNHPRPRMRWTIVGLATMVAVLTAWSWRDPSRMLSSMAGGGDLAAVKTTTGGVFEFGAYPDLERLKALKAEGVTTVISLQDPDVVVERQGIAAEVRAAREVGLTLVQAPMIPWFSENTESLNRVRTIAMTGTGKYYVHCGLGRDRVNIARNLIEGLGVKTATTAGYRQALGFEGRASDFDKGSLISLDPGVWLVPFPVPEEMMGCFFEGRPGQVVVLLDSATAPQDSLLREVHRLFPTYGVRFTVMSPNKPGPAAAAAAVKALKPPVTIIAYRTPWHNSTQKGDEAAIAFANAYRPDSSWKIMTTSPTGPRQLHQMTGGKETGC